MKILIIKTGALGDVLRTSYIAQALKEKFKKNNPQIYWITDKRARPLFVNNPYVDCILDEEKRDSIKGLKFDLVINLEESEELCKFTSSLNAKKIIGLYYLDKVVPTSSTREWFNMSVLGEKPKNDILKKQNKKTHRQIMAEIVGISDYKKYEPFLRLNKKQRNLAEDFLRRYNLNRKDLIIGINTGSADRWPKQLPIKATAKLIDEIYKKYNAKILLFGGQSEITRNEQIKKLVKSPIIDTGCGNDLYEFPALISVCSLFITSDSLGLHISLALKRKTICLFGPTSSAEIEMYGYGKKIIAKSSCICCYKKDCKSMEKISLEEILKTIKELIYQKTILIITAFNEPKIGKAIESALNQKTNYPYEVVVSAPDEKTLKVAKSYSKKYKNLKIFKDPGKGKSFALNILFSTFDCDIMIMTDGDVFISDNAVEEILNLFYNPEIGVISGRPIPEESKTNKYSFWANFLFDSAHKLRENAFRNNYFLECSGYLFAFRKRKIDKIPLDVAEDTIIPYYFWEKGFKIGYAKEAKVFVRNPDNWKDWIKQKSRTSKAHETLEKYADIVTTPRVKSFKNESKGIIWALSYPSSFKEYYWMFQLILARLYMWIKVLVDIKIKNKYYNDAWERVESTKE